MIPHRLSHSAAAGFTFVEMMTSLVIVSVLLVATGSAVLLAARALPGRTTPTSRVIASMNVLDRIDVELAYATTVTEMTDRAITFTIPDHTDDGVDEVIRYAWEGKPGGALTRSFNGSEPGVVLDDVHEFSLTYDLRREALPPTYVESGEVTLFQQDASASQADFTVDASNWIGQSIRPNLPSSVAWWKITRIVIRARARAQAVGETRIQLRDADALGLPGGMIYDQAVMLESALPRSYQATELRFSRGAQFARGATACIVLQWVRDSESCDVQIRTNWVPGGAVVTNTGGLLWSPALSQSMLIQVYGTTGTPEATTYRYALNNVRVTLRSGEEVAGRISGSIVTINAPEVPAP